jgi:murein DD-endopeptidase MepM/ murein hydrolase activator NlpD
MKRLIYGLWSGLVIGASWVPLPASEQVGDSYVLPYPSGTNRKLLQGYAGPWGHQGHAEFSYDFEMPIGSPVIASRPGEVVHLVEHHKDSTRKPGDENVVVIKHADGSFARYYHLTTDGALTRVGDSVAQGQVIARSGDSGASAGPHLHFDVTRGCFEWGTCQTIPVEFANASHNPLEPGGVY